ncbi:hypothetical protein BJY24_007653 [Nocardia transvalensis]|uniref:F5/8 type C domain-containing protein n=1 Tax=Nocardia transvalensis TaxID=37333 RepID=A0A7W9PMD4_9NOCA|nr:hypothetical protein [Nocardia transvalensis]MBB5918741.1 hypothetical protein [Nocardia transvalensis]
MDALLADPALEPSGVSAGDSSSVATGTAVLAEPISGDSADSGDTATEVFGSEPDSMPSEGRRRTSTGPKASDRILALLNGQSQDSPGGLDFGADHSEAAAARLRGSNATTENDAEAGPAPKPESSAASSRPTSVGELGHTAVVYLRRPKVALAVAAVLIVLLIIALLSTGDGDEPSNKVMVTQAPAATAPPSSAPAAPGPSPIQPKSVQAHCPKGATEGMDAFSGEPGKAWRCPRAYKVDGQVLTIDLGKTYDIESIGIVPGFDSVGPDGVDQWNKYRTVSRVSYRFNDATATTYTQQTLDQRNVVNTEIKPAVSASKITLTVLESKGDPSVNITAISSIVITGH